MTGHRAPHRRERLWTRRTWYKAAPREPVRAHSILVICRQLFAHDGDYDDLGGDSVTRRNADRQRDRLIHQLAGLGYAVTLDKTG